MSNYFEFDNKIAFHPGYYIEEIVEESGLTQEDFAKRLDTTPKNLSLLIRGEQSLSNEMAMKLSRLLGTSVVYWLNLQKEYNSLLIESKSYTELIEEKKVFKNLDYKYFREYFNLPAYPRKIDSQIKEVRKFLGISTLNVLCKEDLVTCYRNTNKDISETNTIKANAMVQIAINKALEFKAPKFNKNKFISAANYALSLTRDHEGFYPKIQEAFRKTGVCFVILPNIPGSKTNGATKKIGNNIMLMVNDRRLYADTFWFTLFHEIGHIINGDYGITFEKEDKEDKADRYAEDSLIPCEQYAKFIDEGCFSVKSILEFADSIERDPGIVLGRLQNDKYVDYKDLRMNSLRKQYRFNII